MVGFLIGCTGELSKALHSRHYTLMVVFHVQLEMHCFSSPQSNAERAALALAAEPSQAGAPPLPPSPAHHGAPLQPCLSMDCTGLSCRWMDCWHKHLTQVKLMPDLPCLSNSRARQSGYCNSAHFAFNSELPSHCNLWAYIVGPVIGGGNQDRMPMHHEKGAPLHG